jgi:hypothetical protein
MQVQQFTDLPGFCSHRLDAELEVVADLLL